MKRFTLVASAAFGLALCVSNASAETPKSQKTIFNAFFDALSGKQISELPAQGSPQTGQSHERVAKGSGQRGMASWYALPGRRTACGPIHNPEANTAAHRSLPCGTKVQVVNRNTGKSVVVTINDRGPFIGGRILDLSRGPARQIGMVGTGVAPIEMSVLR